MELSGARNILLGLIAFVASYDPQCCVIQLGECALVESQKDMDSCHEMAGVLVFLKCEIIPDCQPCKECNQLEGKLFLECRDKCTGGSSP